MDSGSTITQLKEQIRQLKQKNQELKEKNAQLKEDLTAYENNTSNVDQCASCYWGKSYNEGNFGVCRKCVSGSEYTPYLDD